MQGGTEEEEIVIRGHWCAAFEAKILQNARNSRINRSYSDLSSEKIEEKDSLQTAFTVKDSKLRFCKLKKIDKSNHVALNFHQRMTSR